MKIFDLTKYWRRGAGHSSGNGVHIVRINASYSGEALKKTGLFINWWRRIFFSESQALDSPLMFAMESEQEII